MDVTYTIDECFVRIHFKLKRIGFLIILLLINIAVLYFVIGTITDWMNIENYGKTVVAEVTDTQISNTRSGTSYDIQYRFHLQNSKQWYTSSDKAFRKNLWLSVPQDVWNIANSSGTIDISYLPRNPWVNEPKANINKANFIILLLDTLLILILTTIATGAFVYIFIKDFIHTRKVIQKYNTAKCYYWWVERI